MSPSSAIPVAVITSGHHHDVINFRRLFRGFPEFDVYVQHIEDFATSPQEVRDSYAVLLFYTMLPGQPDEDGLPPYAGKRLQALSRIGETSQGIFILHHGLLTYPDWPVWPMLVGTAKAHSGFSYEHDVHLAVEVADPEHPITAGLGNWTMTDEVYKMAEPDENSHVLLTTNHPQSMRSLAWTRQYDQSRVFCFQSGHDNQTWQVPQFQTVVRRGLLWCAGKIQTSSA